MRAREEKLIAEGTAASSSDEEDEYEKDSNALGNNGAASGSSQSEPVTPLKKRAAPIKFYRTLNYRTAREREQQRLEDVKKQRLRARKRGKRGKGGEEGKIAEKRALDTNDKDEADQSEDGSLLNKHEFRHWDRHRGMALSTRYSQREDEEELSEHSQLSQSLSQGSNPRGIRPGESEEDTKRRLEVRLDSYFEKELKPHQLAGIRFLYSHIIVSLKRLRKGDQGLGAF